ncbi:SulP family inorganic anion transporter [Nocardia goodfellowii]|uniref:Carbonic anhydrase n=1 Tax=Nocardia goodfellowii TaxID=882446 RepID=A0ABS4QFW8_9NOCA|nr:bifunctional SulP family inorganic anion transporter/carbonic anhydrase [Nocardia goodfellowii]MBP2190577.1 carbonic anhydrase [Nocardia goodfellowii]
MFTDTDSAPRTSPRYTAQWFFDLLRPVLRHDLPASLVVFLVALPLSLGIAVASGAPVASGLVAAVVGGIVGGALGGSVLQVSGPAAGLTVVVASTIAQFGWATTCFITVAAGVLQVLFGFSRIARAALGIAPVVVHAMLAGIGITIALQQIHVLLGGSARSSAWHNVLELPGQLVHSHGPAVLIGGVVIAILLGWRYLPARVRVVPGPLVAVTVGTVLSLVLPVDVGRIPLNGSLFDEIALPRLPEGDWFAVSVTVLTVALIASVQSLLSAVAVDKMHGGERTDFDRELLGQGTANVISGLFGGLPVAGVIVRSSANVDAGARSRASAVLHGIWILVFSVALVGVVRQIPTAALAGLLIVIGIQLVKLAHIRLAHRTRDLVVYTVTVAGVVFLNLLQGVLIGLALAFGLLLWRVVRAHIVAKPWPDGEFGDQWLVTIEGSCTFLALPKLTSELAKVPAGAVVRLEMSVDFLDHAAYEMIEEWVGRHRNSGGVVEFVELGPVRMATATAGPPTRGHARNDEGTGPARRTGHRDDPVVAGISAYHRAHAHPTRPHVDGPRDHHEAETLFLTCSDARIVPNVITNSDPGDLFTVRNVGNLVPIGNGDSSVEAALVYALEKLDVRTVVVCGHSGCGAMDALLRAVQTGQALGEWLAHARPSLAQFRVGHPVARAAAAAGFGEVDQLAMVNVALQLETLHAHPAVHRGMRERGVEVRGLFFDIATARVIEVTVDGLAHFDETPSPIAAESV